MNRRALLSACGTLLAAGCLGDRTGSPGTTDETTRVTTGTTSSTTRSSSTTPSTNTTRTTHSTCTARGSVEPTDHVLGAGGCDSGSASVALEFGQDEFCHAYLLLDTGQGQGDAVQLSEADVTELPELQNAVAYLGPDSTSVRVRTSKRRTDEIFDHLGSLAEEYESTTRFAFDGRTFALLVAQETCVLTTDTTEN
ncbi:hypothetical protein [Haladaptatus sp. NG-SE-30]